MASKAPKNAIGTNAWVAPKKHKRRSAPKPRRHSKSLGPKDDMKRDRGKH